MTRYLPLAGGEGDFLQIDTVERQEGLVVHLSGEVDLANVERLKAAIQPAVSKCQNVILDVGNLRYIDSTGLRVLIDTHRALQQHDCRLFVAGASQGIAKVMHILHLDRQMPVVSSVDEALRLIHKDSPAAASDG